MRIGLTISLLFLPLQALAGMSCEQIIGQTDAVQAGMFQRSSDSVSLINSFPLFASGDKLAYTACPVVDEEASPCSAIILEREGPVMKQTATVPLRGCGPADEWSADCPDFTAEGFTAANAASLADAVKRSEAEICSRFEGQRVAALSPVAGPLPTPSGFQEGSLYELFADCDAAAPGAARQCRADLRFLRGGDGVLILHAADTAFTCTTADDGLLIECLSR